jgi:hypothetical protein
MFFDESLDLAFNTGDFAALDQTLDALGNEIG